MLRLVDREDEEERSSSRVQREIIYKVRANR